MRRDDDRAIRVAIYSMLILTAAMCFAVPGCAQNTEPKTAQSAPATQTNDATNDQRTAGTTYNDNRTFTQNVYNGGPRTAGKSRGTAAEGDNPLSLVDGGKSSADDGGYTQNGTSLSIVSNTTTGGTTPSIGSAAATGTQTASPSQSAPTSADQQVKPAFTIPIAVGWAGGAPSAQGTAAADQSQATATQTNEQRALQQNLKTTTENLKQATEALLNLADKFGNDAKPTTKPTSQPAATTADE